ncbi:MAG: hypothetical protein NZM27_11555, partial [Acetobacteraceae bacterium]|nr:hypothetical protein [Acetobacteraceae bacterium]
MRTLAAALIALPLLAAPAAAQRSGTYEVTGTTLDGRPYSGVALLRQVGLVSWQVLWSVGGAEIQGVGMTAGNVFSVAFDAGESTGLGIYTIASDGTMTGQWTVVGAPAL